jgi:toxin ParE1/3/4
MRVNIREAAYDDLDRIYAWIAKDQPRSADAVTAAILKSIERLGRFPYIGHDGSAAGTFEWVIPGLRYILVYQIREIEDLIFVDAVSTERKPKSAAKGGSDLTVPFTVILGTGAAALSLVARRSCFWTKIACTR